MAVSRRTSSPITAWPGYVDVLSALLMVVIFILMVFVIAQFLLGYVLQTQKSQLIQLNSQISELSELLGLEKEKTVRLEQEMSQVSDTLVAFTEDRQYLLDKVDEMGGQAEKDKTTIEAQLLTMASLNEDIHTLRQLKDALEKEVANMAKSLEQGEDRIAGLRDRSKALTAKLADQVETTFLAQKKIEVQDIRIQALNAVVSTQKQAIEQHKQLSADARAQVAHLSDQIGKLRRQLEIISSALELSKVNITQKDAKIDALGKELNIALARKVNQLEKYRSEFFGRLKSILSDNPAVQIQGDRFVFQAGLLFPSGSARLEENGQVHLAALAQTLLEVSQKIPKDINWILRIDGHSDRMPIRNEEFSSNWELSVARAVSVVRFLSQKKIPEKRMAAAGFSKYHPIDPADTLEAYQKNRRIEIKLTSQ